MQDAIEAFEHFLRAKNLKNSKPRSDILDVFLTSEGHLSAQELYDRVKRKNPRVGFATVYRTLKLLAESGLARSLDYGDGTQRYEPDRFQHHHIICTACNRTIEFLSPELAGLLQDVQQSHDYLPQPHAVRILSMCQDCNQAKPPSARHSSDHDLEVIISRDALEVAMANEEQGLRFYTRAIEIIGDDSTREVLRHLAQDEQQHLAQLQQAYEELRRAQPWLDDEPSLLHFDYERLQGIFPQSQDTIRELVETSGTAEALRMAMAAEQRSYEFFRYYANRVEDARGRAIFTQFAQEEERHLELIQAAYHALQDQAERS
jgi:Fur family transcriptional regulator, ferric uptake regulator